MPISRRDLLTRAGLLGLSAATSQLLPPLAGHAFARAQETAAVPSLDAMRRQMAAVPIEVTKLTNLMTMYSGPGGNVVVRHGEEGKVVVDTFVRGAFAGLEARLDALGDTPVLTVINTHWHFDHTDNNDAFRKAGAEVIAHPGTARRMSERHRLLGMEIGPAPAAALPTRAFERYHVVRFDLPGSEEYIDIEPLPAAHTDTDLSIRFPMGDVIVLGDTFVNGSYPLIDVATGGSIAGLIDAAGISLRDVNPGTRVVPGHGPVGNRAALTAYRDMLVTVRDKVQAMKRQGRAESEVVAQAPTGEFDAMWGHGFVSPASFVSTVYTTL